MTKAFAGMTRRTGQFEQFLHLAIIGAYFTYAGIQLFAGVSGHCAKEVCEKMQIWGI